MVEKGVGEFWYVFFYHGSLHNVTEVSDTNKIPLRRRRVGEKNYSGCSNRTNKATSFHTFFGKPIKFLPFHLNMRRSICVSSHPLVLYKEHSRISLKICLHKNNGDFCVKIQNFLFAYDFNEREFFCQSNDVLARKLKKNVYFWSQLFLCSILTVFTIVYFSRFSAFIEN